MSGYDHIIVGSGINGLVCAALLGKSGKKVLVLERNRVIGGCMRSEEFIAPGFIHDVMAATYVLFITSPGYGELAADLGRHGLEFCQAKYPSGVVMPDGRSMVLSMDRGENIKAFDGLADGDGEAHNAAVTSVEQNGELVFGLLGRQLWSARTAFLLAREVRKRGVRGLAAFFGEGLGTARHWLEAGFSSELARAMWAPWVLHTGLGPESAYSGQMGKVIAFALEAAGAPVVKGGAGNILKAFQGLIEENGGAVRTGAHVERVIVRQGRASAVRLAGGEELAAGSGIICSVTPGQLYGRLLDNPPEPEAKAAGGYRFGNANFQMHYALDAPPKWQNPALNDVALVHLTPGLDGVSKASNEAARGMLPQTPTICVGQPCALDTSRAPRGKAVLWLQMPEAPRLIKGDAAGRIATPGDGRWNTGVSEAFAGRVEKILKQYIRNFDDIVIGRKICSPADIEAMNINLEGGDPYGGYCGLDQFFIWRPFRHSVNHRTPVKNLYHIGASTHPGPGLGGGSGYLVAKMLG